MTHTGPVRHSRRPQRAPAFSLLELLVIVGLVALLIALLLPLLSGIAERGRDLKCQTNLRSIMQAVHGYAAENKGAMPWGFVYNRAGPGHFDEAPENVNGEYVSWATLVGRYMNRDSSGVGDFPATHLSMTFPPALTCPEAAQERAHVVSYVMNWLVGVAPAIEEAHDPDSLDARPRPVRQAQLLKDTVVVFDSGIIPDWDYDARWRLSCDVDDQRFSFRGVNTPQFRYYTVRDVFARIPPGAFGQNRPVTLNVGPHVFYNREPKPLAVERFPYQGNLRFRHRRNTTCNAAFFDGSVRQFTAKLNPDLTVKSHDALRRYFMLRWPPGVRPDRNVPS
jgi:prepilin-type processing-associated H-X9-DG protein